MTFESSSRDQLVEELQALVAAAGVDRRDQERLLHDLHVHQIELELQNRELRETQGLLEASRNRYADLFDFAPIAYFTFDRRGFIDEVNLTGATLIGRDRPQLIGAPFTSLVELVEPALFWAHLRRCEETRAPVVSEFAITLRNPTARQLHVRAISSPVSDLTGQPVAFRTAFIDITDRHAAELARNRALASEQALRRELEQLDRTKTVLAQSLATVSEHSLGAVLQIVVDQAREIAGAEYAALGVGGNPQGDFDVWVYAGLLPDQVASIGRFPRQVGTLGVVVEQAHELRMKDLTSHPAFRGFPAHHPAMTSLLGVPIRFGDRILGTLYLTNKRGGGEFSADDQRSIESLVRYVGAAMEIARLGDEAQDAIRSRDGLLATVSHDLRSPLSAIAISARLLLRMLVPAEQATARRQVDTIARAADRMSRFIDDLLTASTIEAGRLAIAPACEPIEPIIAEALELYAPIAADGSLELAASVPPGLPEVVCDRDRVYQVLANLIGNAVKFTPAGGRIQIAVVPGAGELQISVSDTGPGIAADALPSLFDRYWQGEGSMRHGVGLGLFICKGIVESHHGRIWVDSTPGHGATFTFTLPLVPA